MMALEWIHPDELKNHPTNISIYGDTPDQELVESVRKYGVFEDHPIGYVMDGEFRRIVSGHRRNQAAKITKQESVPIVRLKDIEGDELAIEERIILSNRQRIKTKEQMARESSKLAYILEARAKERQRAAGGDKKHEKQGEKALSPKPDEALPTSGRTDEKVAEALGVGKGQARDLIKAGKALEAAESKGQTKKAESIKKGLEKSAAAGAKAAQPKSTSKPAPRKKADALLAKVTADFSRAAENLAPLVRAFDEIKADDTSFHKKHQELLGHHSRLFLVCEDGKRILKSLNAAWEK